MRWVIKLLLVNQWDVDQWRSLKGHKLHPQEIMTSYFFFQCSAPFLMYSQQQQRTFPAHFIATNATLTHGHSSFLIISCLGLNTDLISCSHVRKTRHFWIVILIFSFHEEGNCRQNDDTHCRSSQRVALLSHASVRDEWSHSMGHDRSVAQWRTMTC